MSFLVKALEPIYYGLKRRKEGDVFEIKFLRHFAPESMEFVDAKDLKAFEDKFDEILEEQKKIYAQKKKQALKPERGKFKRKSDTVPGSGPKAHQMALSQIPNASESKKAESSSKSVI